MKNELKEAFKVFLIIMAIAGAFMLIGAMTKDHSSSSPATSQPIRNERKYTPEKKSTPKKSTTEKSTTEKKQTTPHKELTPKSYDTDDMPDPDDYEDWGEFMDDWDGNMPDGSDASDYWDDW